MISRSTSQSTSEGGRCALVVAGFLSLIVLVAARAQVMPLTSQAATGTAGSTAGSDVGSEKAAAVLKVLAQEPSSRVGELADRGRLLRAGFNAFIERMEAYDGDMSVSLARELFAEDRAVWSAFCLEGALRRSAAADAGPGSAPFDEALSVLEGLRTTYAADPVIRVDLTNRIALLAAGFGARISENAALGRSLAAGGIDGAQIAGLAALSGEPDVAARLFGSLLDRSSLRVISAGDGAENRKDDESVSTSSSIDNVQPPILQPEAAPWALRGHALATLEQLRGPSSIPD